MTASDVLAPDRNGRLPGQYFDAETGMHYNYFRDYDATTGRYVESDPAGMTGGLNLYNYVQGQPTIAIDPKGLVKWTGTVVYASWTIAPRVRGRKIPLTSVSGITLDVESACVDGKKIAATILVDDIDNESWVHFPVAPFFVGSVELEDGLPRPSPAALTGPFSLKAWSFIGGFGSIDAGLASGTFKGGGASTGLYEFTGRGDHAPYYSPKEMSCGCDSP